MTLLVDDIGDVGKTTREPSILRGESNIKAFDGASHLARGRSRQLN